MKDQYIIQLVPLSKAEKAFLDAKAKEAGVSWEEYARRLVKEDLALAKAEKARSARKGR